MTYLDDENYVKPPRILISEMLEKLERWDKAVEEENKAAEIAYNKK
jgi:hypothetical protein